MRRLSGWARLWIVAAVLMWAGGGWWLSENPPYRGSASVGCAYDIPFSNVPGFELTEEERAEHRECVNAEARHYRENKATIDEAAAVREREYQWRLWLQVGAVVLAPFAAGALAWLMSMIGLWVWRGFRPQSN